jgi:hypothetical protein
MEGTQGVFAQLDLHLRLSLRAKAAEFGTLSKDRLYCPRPTCSAFLGSTANRTSDIACPRCRTAVCVRCKQAVHPERGCEDNTALEQVKTLALEQHWQTCPGCGQIIDLQQGCFHMTCRCRTEFCYVCAERWKNCACPQWEEQRLLNTAEQRVENEMGARARAAAPDIFVQRVQQRVERLRFDQDCATGHRWRRNNGQARCDECRFMLREYLLVRLDRLQRRITDHEYYHFSFAGRVESPCAFAARGIACEVEAHAKKPKIRLDYEIGTNMTS